MSCIVQPYRSEEGVQSRESMLISDANVGIGSRVNQIADDQPYLRIENLSKVYATRAGEVRALNGISFTQRRDEFISHVGPSGCGKSTLLMIAAGLIPPSSGAVKVGGHTVQRPRTDIGIVFQSPVLLDWRTARKTSCCRPKRGR